MKSFSDIYSIISKDYSNTNTSSQLYKNYKKNITIKIILTISIIVLDIILFNILPYFGFIFILPFSLAIFFIWTRFNIKDYKDGYKHFIVSKLVENAEDGFLFKPNALISSIEYVNAEFNERFDKFLCEDKIEGFLDDDKFEMAELNLKAKQYDPETNREREVCVFSGAFLALTFSSSIDCTTLIRKNKLIDITPSKRMQKQRRNIQIEAVDKIDLDDSEFQKIFDVYSSNRIISTQLLSASVMESLVNFKKTYKLLPEVTIKNNKLYIRFSMEDTLFEPPKYKSPLDYISIQKQYRFICSILNLCKDISKNIKSIEQ